MTSSRISDDCLYSELRILVAREYKRKLLRSFIHSTNFCTDIPNLSMNPASFNTFAHIWRPKGRTQNVCLQALVL
jgi:hypothetical protein